MGRFGELATHTLLNEAMIVMGVNPHQLAKQLGVKHVVNIYSWLNGSSHPSQGFLIRLSKLLILRLSGVRLAEAAWIDWEEGEIHWKKGFGDQTAVEILADSTDPDEPEPVRAGSYRGLQSGS